MRGPEPDVNINIQNKKNLIDSVHIIQILTKTKKIFSLSYSAGAEFCGNKNINQNCAGKMETTKFLVKSKYKI